MKKFVTFPNFIAFIGILCLGLGFIPSFGIINAGEETAYVNLYQATFGGSYTIIPAGETTKVCSLWPCAGLIVAFCLLVVAIALSIFKIKLKAATLFAFPFYLASAILLCNAIPMLKDANIHGINPGSITGNGFEYAATAVAIIVLLFVAAAFSLFDFIGTIAATSSKTNKKPVY